MTDHYEELLEYLESMGTPEQLEEAILEAEENRDG